MIWNTIETLAETAAETVAETVAETLPIAEEVQSDLAQLKPNVMLETIKGWLPGLLAFGYKLLIAVLIFAVGSRIIKLIRRIMDRSFQRMEMEISLRKFLLSLINASLYAILVFMAIEKIGFNSASIVAILGSAGIALGLALQGSLANFAGGVLILLMRPFKVGDYIISKEGEGTVSVIGLVYTTLKTVDNKLIVIPNGTLSDDSLTNVTAQEKRRVDIRVGIGYSSDLKKAKKIIESIYINHPLVLKDEDVVVFVDELAESSVVIGARGWAATEDYWTVKWDILERVKLTFDEEGIEIPFNQLDVHMR